MTNFDTRAVSASPPRYLVMPTLSSLEESHTEPIFGTTPVQNMVSVSVRNTYKFASSLEFLATSANWLNV
jgi:hypothetical protein